MRAFLVLFLAMAAGSALAAPAPDAFSGNCASCHGVDAASSIVAPTLRGVVGRKVASLKDFDYSPALKAKGGVWTEAALDTFIKDPQAYAPGTAMPVGEANAANRQAIIAYLKTVK